MNAGRKAPVPGVLAASLGFEGRTYMLALVRTWWLNEGTVIFEALAIDGTDSVAVEAGTWAIRRDDAGPATLEVEVMIPQDLTSNEKQLADRLMAELVRVGASWGIESFAEAS